MPFLPLAIENFHFQPVDFLCQGSLLLWACLCPMSLFRLPSPDALLLRPVPLSFSSVGGAFPAHVVLFISKVLAIQSGAQTHSWGLRWEPVRKAASWAPELPDQNLLLGIANAQKSLEALFQTPVTLIYWASSPGDGLILKCPPECGPCFLVWVVIFGDKGRQLRFTCGIIYSLRTTWGHCRSSINIQLISCRLDL